MIIMSFYTVCKDIYYFSISYKKIRFFRFIKILSLISFLFFSFFHTFAPSKIVYDKDNYLSTKYKMDYANN